MDMFNLHIELEKLKTLAICLEDRLHEADIIVNEKGEHVFCLVDLLQGRIDALIDSAGNLKGGAA